MSMSLAEIRDFFEQAEMESDLARKVALLNDALDEADGYLMEQLSEQDKQIVGNLRRTHMRKLLRQLAGMRQIGIDVWVRYLMLLAR
jgi:hypothetical protein